MIYAVYWVKKVPCLSKDIALRSITEAFKQYTNLINFSENAKSIVKTISGFGPLEYCWLGTLKSAAVVSDFLFSYKNVRGSIQEL